MENLSIYNQVRVCPQEARKTIKGGRLSGMTDINPQYRIQMLTAVFGPCGIGWKITIDRQWVENYGQETKAFCNVSLFVKVDGEWSDAIQGTGGSTMVENGRNGMYVNDEAYKMAYTDAISVACKMLGVAADIYWEKGARYGTKYEAPAAPSAPSVAAPAVSPTPVALPQAVADEIAAATSRDALSSLFKKYTAYSSLQSFRDLLNKRWKEVAA